MPLSLTKLQEFLNNQGFAINTFFFYRKKCLLLEIISISNNCTFLLYIPKKYKFRYSDDGKNKKSSLYSLEYVNISNIDTIEEYTKNINNKDAEEIYGDMDIELEPGDKNFEEFLQDRYKKYISLKDISSDDTKDINSIYRQIKRLGYCVENISYKVGIIYKNYITFITKNNKVVCFIIKHFPRKDIKRLMIIVNLETLYEKQNQILVDIDTVRSSIYRILEKNQKSHSSSIKKLIENKTEIINISDSTTNLDKTKYGVFISRLELLISNLSIVEQKYEDELEDLNNNNEKTGLSGDTDRAIIKANLNKQLSFIFDLKKESTLLLFQLRQKMENNLLNVDKILFDNTVIFNNMFKNFNSLKDFLN